jgi:beta-lactamase regulating signal transducer with metallopeptidase domain
LKKNGIIFLMLNNGNVLKKMINHHYQPRICYAPMPRILKIDYIILVLWIFSDGTRSQTIIIIIINKTRFSRKLQKNDQQQLR